MNAGFNLIAFASFLSLMSYSTLSAQDGAGSALKRHHMQIQYAILANQLEYNKDIYWRQGVSAQYGFRINARSTIVTSALMGDMELLNANKRDIYFRSALEVPPHVWESFEAISKVFGQVYDE